MAPLVDSRYRFQMLALAIGRPALFALGSICALGCATQRELIDRSASAAVSPCSFWPPPSGASLSASTSASAARAGELSRIAHRIATELHAAGYQERRWYPIGLEYRHGFAVTTRLEAVNDDATPKSGPERWSALYPDAVNLRWLTLARRVPLPHPGRYRAFLFAVTDLPLGASSLAPRWNEDTVMDGPGVIARKSTPDEMSASRDLSSYRLGVYVYQYERKQDQPQGELSARGIGESATPQLRGAALAHLVEASLVDAR